MRRTVVANINKNAFVSETGAALNQQIEVLATLTAALLGELELLQFTVAATHTDSLTGPEAPLAEVREADFRVDFYKEVERYEIALIKGALKQSRGNQRKAAQLLAMNSTTLNAKIKHYGIYTVDVIAQYASHLDGSVSTRHVSHHAHDARPRSSEDGA
jgi:DNA-binding NtrC family response regulator